MLPKDNSNIAVFSLAYKPFEGGAELAVKEITTKIKDYKFTCFSYRFEYGWPKEEYVEKVRVMRLGRGRKATDKNLRRYYGTFAKLKFAIYAWRKAEELHKKNPFILIWGIMAAYGGVSALLFKLRHPKVPFLLTLQEGDSEEHILKRVGIFYPFWKLIFKKADYIQAISSYLADFARRHGAKCPVEVVPNGVDVKKFQTPNNKLQTNSNDQKRKFKTIITTSRLVYKNGIDILIKAVSKLPITNYQLLIVGGGLEEVKLKKLAKDLKVDDKVEFSGQIEADKIPVYLAQADIFVRPSRSEGLGSSFLEAMAAGLPVIGTKVGGIPDFLRDRETGLFAAVHDPRDLAEKIAVLLKDDNLRRKLGENSRKLVLKSYSWDLIAGKMEKIFSVLLSPRKKILFAAGIYPPDIGGPALHVKRLVDGFLAAGFRAEVITYGESPGAISRGVPKPFRGFLYLWKVLMTGRKADCIYAQDATATGLPALIASKILGKALYLRVGGDILWERAVERGERFMPMREYYEQNFHLKDRRRMFLSIKKVLDKAKSIAVTTPILEAIYVDFYGIPAGKIKVILNPFVSYEESGHPEADRGRLKDLAHEEAVILFAGRFVPYKNLKFVMKVFDNLRKKLNKGRLVLIGDGPDRDELLAFKTNLASADSIKILPPAARDELFNHIAKARVCLAPALTEFNPNFILECLSLGKPVLVSRENGLPVNLADDFLFDSRDGREFEDKLRRFFDEGFYRKALRDISEISIDQSWDKVLSEHLTLLNL